MKPPPGIPTRLATYNNIPSQARLSVATSPVLGHDSRLVTCGDEPVAMPLLSTPVVLMQGQLDTAGIGGFVGGPQVQEWLR